MVEDFDYPSKEALKQSGWRFFEGPINRVSISQGEITLGNDNAPWEFVRMSWDEEEVYDWKYTAMAKLVGEHSINLLILVSIHNNLSGPPTEYVYHIGYSGFTFTRNHPDYEILLNGTYGTRTKQNNWFTFSLERRGPTFRMYIDDSLKDEINIENLGPLTEFGISTGTNSITKFEWLRIEYEKGLPEQPNVWWYLFGDLLSLSICVVLIPFGAYAYKIHGKSKRYLVIPFSILLTALIVFLFLLRKFGLSDDTVISIGISLMVGLVSGTFLEAFRQRRDEAIEAELVPESARANTAVE